jgi:hypothetical protein
MALATVIIQEGNGGTPGSPSLTTATNSNVGILDTPNTTLATAFAIPADSYSYEKWQRLAVTVNGSSNTIKGIRVWRTGTLGGASDTHLTNARTTGYADTSTYAVPLLTVSSYTQTMPTSDPGAANLGIAGSLAGTITSAPQYSDYLVHQIHVHSSTTAGPAAANTLYFQYDEYA